MKQMYSVVYMVNITKDYAEQEIAKKHKAPKNKEKTNKYYTTHTNKKLDKDTSMKPEQSG